MFNWMTENGRLRNRYGDRLDARSLSDAQRAFFLNEDVRDNKDPMGNYTVQMITSGIAEVHFAFTDVYCFDDHGDRKHWMTYASERNDIYRELFGKYPEFTGSNESRYRLDDASLISITIDAMDHTIQPARRSK